MQQLFNHRAMSKCLASSARYVLSDISTRIPLLSGVLTVQLIILELFQLNEAIWLHITKKIRIPIIIIQVQINEVRRINLRNTHLHVIDEIRLQLYDDISLYVES